MRSVAGTLAVVTGAGSGIGRATGLRLAAAGARLLLADIDETAAQRTAELIRGGDAATYRVDVGDAHAMQAFAEWVRSEHGVPDIIVNNAGIGVSGPLLDTSLEQWERLLRVNLWGVIHGCRLFAPMLVERGRGGHIVNVASAAGFAPLRALPAYGTTKAAVLMLSRCWRLELARYGVGVSVICPGLIDTPIVERTEYVGGDATDRQRRRTAALRLYRRRGHPAEMVAEQIHAAVVRNRGVVPVTPEAWVSHVASSWFPPLARLMAGLGPVARR